MTNLDNLIARQDASEIAAGLMEAQRRAMLSETIEIARRQVLQGIHGGTIRGLVEKGLTGPEWWRVCALTDLGLAVRRILEEGK